MSKLTKQVTKDIKKYALVEHRLDHVEGYSDEFMRLYPKVGRKMHARLNAKKTKTGLKISPLTLLIIGGGAYAAHEFGLDQTALREIQKTKAWIDDKIKVEKAKRQEN